MHMDKSNFDRIWDLAVKKVHNSLTSEEENEWEGVSDSEQTGDILKQVEQIHQKSSKSFLMKSINKEKNWNYIHGKINKTPKIRQLYIDIAKYAAVFMVAVFLGILIPRSFIFKPQEQALNKVEMDWGQMGKIFLSDGTQVWLNAGTTLEYPASFDKKTRTVSLNGEAQFKVTHNKKIPFEVETSTGIIKVYGTTFNVASYDDDSEMTVTLVEGKVTVEKPNGDYLTALKPSEQLTINKVSGKATLRYVDTEFYSSWIEGKILLEETELSDLVKILERWYNVDIKIMDEEISNLKISGTISKNKPLDLFLKIVERMYGVNYKLVIKPNNKDEVLIYKNEVPMI